MDDNTDDRLDRLFAAVRSGRPDTAAVEAHFETRLMARIEERRVQGAAWYMLAWRMIPAFGVIAAISAICSVTFNPASSEDLFAAITTGQEEYLTNSYLTGESR